MKKLFILMTALMCCAGIQAQDKKADESKGPEYKFTTVKENPITSVKDQYRSGTCWCFSGLSFIESEILRSQGKTFDLAEMWIVGHAYHDRAVKYVRLDGALGFSAGSCFGDVLAVIKNYGIVPQNIYNGMNYGYDKPQQAEMDAVLKAYVDALISKPNKTTSNPWSLSTVWKDGFDAVIQAYLGKWPDEFEYDGKKYTPATFRDNCLKISTDDYVNICSFQAEPWYKPCVIEVCDNWRANTGYNVPLEDMKRILFNAIENGYTALWGGDVSEKGCFDRDGLGVMPVPAKDKKQAGSDQEHWVGKDTKAEQKDESKEIPAEIEVSDSLRQSAYDRKLTTDDHGMHIYGIAQDQNGTKYFMVKNSWGDAGKYKGIWYMSETYIAYKTMNFVVHKDALPKDIRKKLGIK